MGPVKLAKPIKHAHDAVPSERQLHRDLKRVKNWLNSAKGIEVSKAKSLFGLLEPNKAMWKSGDHSGDQFVYRFDGYEIKLLCSAGFVVPATVSIGSD